MTTQREATWWMVAAMAVVVWACIGTGCQTARTPLQAVAPKVTPDQVTEAHAAALTSITAADTPGPSDYHGAAANANAAMTTDGAATGDGSDVAQRSVFNLPSILSLATPWHTTQELITSAITLFHAYPPDRVQQSFRPEVTLDLDVALQSQPLYEALTLRDVSDDAAASFWSLSLASDPFVPNPPRPDLGALRMQQPAKFDGAGVVLAVLGAMVLIFGGEAVVLWMVIRKPQAIPTSYIAHAADDWTDFPLPYSISMGSPGISRRAA